MRERERERERVEREGGREGKTEREGREGERGERGEREGGEREGGREGERSFTVVDKLAVDLCLERILQYKIQNVSRVKDLLRLCG